MPCCHRSRFLTLVGMIGKRPHEITIIGELYRDGSATNCTGVCRLVVHRRGQMGSGSQVLNCLVQRLTVYTVATVYSHLSTCIAFGQPRFLVAT